MMFRRTTPFLSAIIALILLVACSEDSTDPVDKTGRVEGRVTLYGTDDPVADVALLLVGAGSLAPAKPVTTGDDEGTYRFDEVPAGTYAVFVYHDSLVTYDRSASLVEVRGGATVRHDMRVTDSELWNARGDRVEGTVTDAVTGEPIVGAYVSSEFGVFEEIDALMAGISLPDWGVTDAQGFYSVVVGDVVDETGQPIGSLSLACTKEGYLPKMLARPLLARILEPAPVVRSAARDTVFTVDMALEPITSVDEDAFGVVTGQLLHRGDPAAQIGVAIALLSVRNPDPLPDKIIVPGATAQTDAEGRFTLSGLVAGTYSLSPGYQIGDGYGGLNWHYEDQEFDIAAGDTTRLGEIEVLRTIGQISPANGATDVATTPRLTWEAVPGADAYGVQWRVDGYLMDYVEDDLEEPEFQIPDDLAIPHGSCVRWMVRATAFDPDLGHRVSLARSDWSLVFCVIADAPD